jgi:hypothetical protein
VSASILTRLLLRSLYRLDGRARTFLPRRRRSPAPRVDRRRDPALPLA